MTSDPRFVLDTNVIVSALLFKESTARQAFDKAMTDGTLLLSLDTLNELNDVLRRPKFNKYISEEDRLGFLTALMRETKLIEITVTITACRDPKDNKFLELAVSGNAQSIISGDDDLLSMHPFRGIAIYSPRRFLEEYRFQ